MYSEHVNPKRGHFSISVQRRLVVFHWMLGGKMISLRYIDRENSFTWKANCFSFSSRYPIELNRWHQCSIEIYGQKLSLVVDDEAPVVTYELFSNNFLWPRSSTFLGHLPIQYRSLDALTSPIILDGFRGAIQKVKWNRITRKWKQRKPNLLSDFYQRSIIDWCSSRCSRNVQHHWLFWISLSSESVFIERDLFS